MVEQEFYLQVLRKCYKRFIEKQMVNYGNGRYVRKILEEAGMNLAERCYRYDVSSKIRIGFAC